MSFDKDYPNRKDQRQQYRKAGRCDRTCRPGGTCPYCLSNRLRWKAFEKIVKREHEKGE